MAIKVSSLEAIHSDLKPGSDSQPKAGEELRDELRDEGKDKAGEIISDRVSERVSDKVGQPPLMAGTKTTPMLSQKVYCAEDSPLRLGDGTPLHLEWVIEGRDGELYRVLSEPGGWLRRTPYRGNLDGMQLVPPEKAETILCLTYADTDGDDLSRVWRRDGYRGLERLSEYPLGRWSC